MLKTLSLLFYAIVNLSFAFEVSSECQQDVDFYLESLKQNHSGWALKSNYSV